MNNNKTSNSRIVAAIIGSFKQHYKAICEIWHLFNEAGLIVSTPKGTPILKEGVPFVRFVSDPSDWDDNCIETVVLHRIFRSHFVYVVAPAGYIGRTTCYEIGRIIQYKRPIYFSEKPIDLPIAIPKEHVLAPQQLIKLIKHNPSSVKNLYSLKTNEYNLEYNLSNNQILNDEDIVKHLSVKELKVL